MSTGLQTNGITRVSMVDGWGQILTIAPSLLHRPASKNKAMERWSDS